VHQKIATSVKLFSTCGVSDVLGLRLTTRYPAVMLVTVPDPGLGELLASQARLLQAWPDAAFEVMKFITVLRCSTPSLAEALTLGLVVLAAPAAALGAVDLRYRRAEMSAIGRRGDGTEVQRPHEHLGEVTCIEIRDVMVAGRAGLRTAA
jgi:hypothetical protein